MNGMRAAEAQGRLATMMEEGRSLLEAFEQLLAGPAGLRASVVAARAPAGAAEVERSDGPHWPGEGGAGLEGSGLRAASERALQRRVWRWKEEAGPLLEAVGRILEESARLRAGAAAAARERERLRAEIHGLRSEGQQVRRAIHDVQRLLSEVLPRLGGTLPPASGASPRG